MKKDNTIEAINFLKKENILDLVVKDMDELGYVGEEKNKKLGYLISISRKLSDPLSGVIVSSSSAGKSGLVESLEKLAPSNEVITLSNLTPQALYYMPKDYLKHKLLIVEERKGSELSDYSIRVLQSRKKLVHATALRDKTSGEIRTKIIEVDGPVSVLETTTSNRINPENASRVFELYLDESPEQTRRIHEFQKQTKTLSWLDKQKRQKRICKRHHNIQNLLQPVKVINPFVGKIQFPVHMVRTRRDHLRFLNLIEVITFLYQQQRERKHHKGTIYIESTIDDYRIAYDLMKDIMTHSLDLLSKPNRDLYQYIRKVVNGSKTFSRKDIEKASSWPIHRIRDNMRQLLEHRYVEVVAREQGKSIYYRLNKSQDDYAWLKNLTQPEELGSSTGQTIGN